MWYFNLENQDFAVSRERRFIEIFFNFDINIRLTKEFKKKCVIFW